MQTQSQWTPWMKQSWLGERRRIATLFELTQLGITNAQPAVYLQGFLDCMCLLMNSVMFKNVL